MTEHDPQTSAVQLATEAFNECRVLLERQVEYAREAAYKEQYVQARIHLESAVRLAERAEKAGLSLDKARRRAANAVPYA